VTLHSAPLASLDDTIKGLTVEMTLSQPTISALVALLLFLESAKNIRISSALQKTVFTLDERMDDHPDSVKANEIRDQKRSLRTLDTVVGAQINCFEYVGALTRPFLNLKALTTRFQLVQSNARAANQTVDRLEKTISDIHQRFEMNQQEKTNRRLAVLTILSAIFMPLTFIAGIYGMNFDNMPELQQAFGYPVVLIFMALLGGGMYIYFKKRGWLN
jgi:magnesium transporter